MDLCHIILYLGVSEAVIGILSGSRFARISAGVQPAIGAAAQLAVAANVLLCRKGAQNSSLLTTSLRVLQQFLKGQKKLVIN